MCKVLLFLRVLHLIYSAPLQPSQQLSGYPKLIPKIPLVIPIPFELQAQRLPSRVEASSILTVPVGVELPSLNKKFTDFKKDEGHVDALGVMNEEGQLISDNPCSTVNQLIFDGEILDGRPCEDQKLNNIKDLPGKETEIVEVEALTPSPSEEKVGKGETSPADLKKEEVVPNDNDAEIEVEAFTPSPSEEIAKNVDTIQDKLKKKENSKKENNAGVEAIIEVEIEALTPSPSEEIAQNVDTIQDELKKKGDKKKENNTGLEEIVEVEIEALTPSPSEEKIGTSLVNQNIVTNDNDADIEVEALTPSPSEEIADNFDSHQDHQNADEVLDDSDIEVEVDAATPSPEEETKVGLPNSEETSEGEDEKIDNDKTSGGIAQVESSTGGKVFNAVPNGSAIVGDVEDAEDGKEIQINIGPSNLVPEGNFLVQYEILKPVVSYEQLLQSGVDGAVNSATLPVIDSDSDSEGNLIPYLVRETNYYYYYPTEN